VSKSLILAAPRKSGGLLTRYGRVGLALFAAASALLAPPVFAADEVTESRPVGEFRSVKLLGSADLVLTQADTPSLSFVGDKDAIGSMRVETRGDELVLIYEPKGMRGGWWGSDKKGPHFVLAVKSIDRLSSSGSGDIHAASLTVPGDFEISISGSSDVKFDTLAARKLLVRITGSGDVQLSGGVLEQNVRISGSGDYRSGRLQSSVATISIGGSGDATLWARDNLAVKIAGSGDVKYYGKPAVTKSIAGSGSVAALGEKPADKSADKP
jgi:Putative auto-transporter adhesin, head GIN domain